MKIIKYLLLIFFIISFIIFLLPFLLKGILNIGNIAGMIVSLGCFLIIFFNKPLHHLIFSKIILSFIIILLAIISTCSYKILTNMNILPQEETTVVVLGCRVKNKKPSLALKERLDKTYQYLNENNVEKCKIKITDLLKQDKPMEKGIKFIVTDQKIIEQCHGIIQGMSGSPIIQNNKLIGCVTHASKSEILEGYGMYIQWMIDNE